MTNEDLKNYVFNKYGIKLCNDDADLLTDFFKVVEQDRRKQTSTQLDNIFNEIKWFDINEIYKTVNALSYIHIITTQKRHIFL